MFSIMNAKYLIMQHKKIEVYTLKMYTIIWHCIQIPVTFEQGCSWAIHYTMTVWILAENSIFVNGSGIY